MIPTVDAPRKESKREKKRKQIVARERFKRSRLAEKAFGRKLKRVASEVGKIIKRHAPEGLVKNMGELQRSLSKYAQVLVPWAKSAAQSMVNEVAQRDLRTWSSVGNEIGRMLKQEVKSAPIGTAMARLMAEQVVLITSLPRQAANRVHKLTIEGMVGGTRAKEIAKEILRSGKVTEARAMLIARTETSRTSTAMVQSRATHIGSDGYIWRSSEDSDVRPRHKKLDGKFIRWDTPPVAGEDGERYHAGAGPNCRCYPEPVVPDAL